MYLNTFSRARFFKIQSLDMKSNSCERNNLQLKYFVLARFSNTGLFLSHPVWDYYTDCETVVCVLRIQILSTLADFWKLNSMSLFPHKFCEVSKTVLHTSFSVVRYPCRWSLEEETFDGLISYFPSFSLISHRAAYIIKKFKIHQLSKFLYEYLGP